MFTSLRALFRPSKSRHRTEKPATLGDAKWLVVGLGNPGAKYDATRHNVGYMVLDQLIAEISDSPLELEPVEGVKARVAIADHVAYARTTTFMNESGQGVGPLAARLGIAADRVLVVHDELDLPPGTVKLRMGGNENGHNGLKSITQHLGTREYPRVRVGIGRPPKGDSIIDWVLGPVAGGPTGIADQIALAARAARLTTEQGLAQAQNIIHAR